MSSVKPHRLIVRATASVDSQRRYVQEVSVDSSISHLERKQHTIEIHVIKRSLVNLSFWWHEIINVHFNTFFWIRDAIRYMTTLPRTVTLKVPRKEQVKNQHIVTVYRPDKVTICLMFHENVPESIHTIVLTLKMWKGIIRCYEENKGKFPYKKKR